MKIWGKRIVMEILLQNYQEGNNINVIIILFTPKSQQIATNNVYVNLSSAIRAKYLWYSSKATWNMRIEHMQLIGQKRGVHNSEFLSTWFWNF